MTRTFCALALVATLPAAAAFVGLPRRALPTKTARNAAGLPRQALPTMYVPEVPLDREELEAIAGLWVASLALDDGARDVAFYLASGSGECPGKVTTLGALDAHSTHSAWEAKAVPGSKRVNLRVHLGPWMLEGRAERRGGDDGGGLRLVGPLEGSVLEGEDDPDYCGSFRASCSLPSTDDAALPALEARHRARVEARPAPPTTYARESFAGAWSLFAAFDLEGPAIVPLVLTATDRSFRSVPSELVGDGGGGELVGSWGVWSPTVDGSKQSAAECKGTHLWLRVDRERSTQACGGGGLGGLPVYDGFSMWGVPVPLSLEAELFGRAAGGEASAMRVDGQTYYGVGSRHDMVQTGRFSLSRLPAEGAPGQEEAAEKAAEDSEGGAGRRGGAA